MRVPRLLIPLLLAVLVALVACDNQRETTIAGSSGGPPQPAPGSYTETGGVPRPGNAIDIYIAYSLGSQAYLPEIIRRFNQAYADGVNPLTDQKLAADERPIYVWGTPPVTGSSGTQAQGIVNAILAPNNANVYRPTIYQPSVSHWLSWVNFNAGRQVFDLSNIQGTALSPVVVAIWEDRLNQLIQLTGKPRDQIGWADILPVLQNGWPEGRRAVYYGHTDPRASSTGLSTTIAEFYACARQAGFTGRRLTPEAVNDAKTQACMRDIQNLVRHYSTRTEDFLEYVGQGPEYVDMIGMEETRLLCVNTGRTLENEQCLKPQGGRLVALYPAEGTFWHENPFGIVNADWVTPEQAEAARVFTDFVRSTPSQAYITEFGYRPTRPDVPLGPLFIEENGILPEGPATTLDIPDIAVINTIQQSWSLVKKQADVLLLIDISGSMLDEGKLDQAKQAAQVFLDKMELTNRVGLAVFNDQFQVLVPMATLETNGADLRSRIANLRADGGTALYAALRDSLKLLNQPSEADRIRGLVLLSDGADTASAGVSLNDVINAIQASRDTLNPVIVVPVAYGSNADVTTLNAIARASNTRIQSGDPANIQRVLQLLGSYF